MSESGGGPPDGAESGAVFEPREDLVSVLTSMGVSRNAAIKGLYYTGNYNADLAAAWIFENQDQDLDSSSLPGDISESSEEEEVGVAGFLDDDGAFCKMVMVVNTELGMGVGKTGAQCAHAALGIYRLVLEDQHRYGDMLLNWEQFGETKVVLKGNNTSHLLEMAARATTLGLPNRLVHDAGKTQVPEGSVTVLAILGKGNLVDQVTGTLSLL